MVSEKARSEFMVVPILLAASESFAGDLTIFSGQRLDVDPILGLVGECDFILALTPPIPRLKAPLVTILEAKKGGHRSRAGTVHRPVGRGSALQRASGRAGCGLSSAA